jgi:hypothetical protein
MQTLRRSVLEASPEGSNLRKAKSFLQGVKCTNNHMNHTVN